MYIKAQCAKRNKLDKEKRDDRRKNMLADKAAAEAERERCLKKMRKSREQKVDGAIAFVRTKWSQNPTQWSLTIKPTVSHTSLSSPYSSSGSSCATARWP